MAGATVDSEGDAALTRALRLVVARRGAGENINPASGVRRTSFFSSANRPDRLRKANSSRSSPILQFFDEHMAVERPRPAPKRSARRFFQLFSIGN
jgi:hypothetical protein